MAMYSNYSSSSKDIFTFIFIISQILGFITIILTFLWLGKYSGGFSIYDKKLVFNYHPLCMIFGLVLLYGDAILVYRVFRKIKKLYVKILHGILHISAFIFSVFGMKAIFDHKNASNISHLYSIHGWLGLIVIILFGLQWCASLIIFLVPRTPMRVRSTFLPVHVIFGTFLYMMVIVVCISGITEKNYFSQNYNKLRTGEMIGNFIGLFVVLFGVTVFYLVQYPDYKRHEVISPEHQALHQHD